MAPLSTSHRTSSSQMAATPLGIVGGGHAAEALVRKLRSLGYQHPVTIYEKSKFPPYAKPPLSKEALEQGQGIQMLQLFGEPELDSLGITVEIGKSLSSVEKANSGIELIFDDQSSNFHQKVVLATGVEARKLSLGSNPRTPVAYLQSLSDLIGLRQHLSSKKRILIIGAGFIGLETASSLSTLGHQVFVLERSEHVMSRVLSPISASFFENLHRKNGVNLIMPASISEVEFDPASDATSFHLDNGEMLTVDLVFVSIGVEPATNFTSSELQRDGNHLVVDDRGRTNLENLFAMGDIAASPGRSPDLARVKIQSIDAAVVTAERVAHEIAGLTPEPQRWVPRFWSVQHGAKIQIAGLANPGSVHLQRAVEGEGKSLVGVFDKDCLIAVEVIGMPLEFAALRKALVAGADISPEEFVDPMQDIKSLAAEKVVARLELE